MSALGFAKAVTEAVKHDTDRWLLWMPKHPGKPGRFSPSRPVLSISTEAALRATPHDQLDAARMRLCLDDSDVIRRIYREGV